MMGVSKAAVARSSHPVGWGIVLAGLNGVGDFEVPNARKPELQAKVAEKQAWWSMKDRGVAEVVVGEMNWNPFLR